MIYFNGIDLEYKQDYLDQIKRTVDSSRVLGGLWSETNLELSSRLESWIGTNIVVNSGTNAMLMALEWIESNHDQVQYKVSEYSYFWIWGFLKNRNYTVLKTTNQVDFETDFTTSDMALEVYIITSHNEINAREFKRSKRSIVIEDRCQMFGHHTDLISDIRIYSFSNNKILQGGEGGALATNIPDLLSWARTRSFCDVNPTRSNPYFFLLGQYRPGQSELPFKSSISALVSSFLLGQISRLEHTREIRQHNYHRLTELKFSDYQQQSSEFPLGYPLYIDNLDSKTRLKFQLFLLNQSIQSYTGVLPLEHYLNDYYIKNTIMLPVHPQLTDEQITYIINRVKLAYDQIIRIKNINS
jgi:dTDP-4-amino-4,6-dideoxygalactose transaminase